MDKWFHPTLYKGCNYLSVLGLQLNHVSKRLVGGDEYMIPRILSSHFLPRWRHSVAWITGTCNNMGKLSGLCSSVKTVFPWYHYKDKTVVRQSYLYNRNSYTDQTQYLYWDVPYKTKSREISSCCKIVYDVPPITETTYVQHNFYLG